MVDVGHVRVALNAFESGADRAYFFKQLPSPAWIRPLLEEGVFDSPDWPEVRYLQRMAENAEEYDVHELILEVLLHMPAPESDQLNRMLTEIALELPPDLAEEWAKEERKQLQADTRVESLKAETLGRLAVHIGHGGNVKFALHMLHQLLGVYPNRPEETEGTYSHQRPQIRMEEWRYEDILSEHLSELVKLGGIDVLTILLCPLLEDAVRYDLADPENDGDFSCIWKPTIEGDERVHHPHEALTVALRDAVEQLAEQDAGSVPEIIQILEDQDPLRPVFRRIALHLMRLYPDDARDEVVQHVLDRELIEARETWHEYALLLKTVFPSLDEQERSTLLENIFSRPSIDPKVAEDLSEKRLQQRIDRWKLRRLSLISDHLSGDEAQRYQALVDEYGEYDNPEGPEFGTATTWVGPTSPKNKEELNSLPPEDVVEYLSSWEPSGQRMTPTPEGLGRIFESVVAENPSAFAGLAARFRELDPTYVRSFISGLEKATGEIDWAPVVDLCQWVTEQARVPEERQLSTSTYGDDVDPDWRWTRKRIASLLEKGVQGDSIPFELRQQVWSVLKSLTEDPEPTPEYEAKYGGDNMDPLTLSINTVRGEAMHAVVRYALWVRRHELVDDADPTPNGFDQIAEVREVLDQHLDIEQDPSLAVRSVYGRWYPQLYLLDTTWALGHRAQIFTPEEGKEEYRTAAWGAYIFSNRVFNDIFEALRKEYQAAIDRLPDGGEAGMRDTKRDLAEHLMIAYWRGEESLDDDGLIKRFFAAADDDLRNYAIQRVGQHAESSGIDEEKAPGIRRRLRDLWEFRLAAAHGGGDDTYKKELAAFGWWLVSGEFDKEYALQKMIETLQITGKAEPEIQFLETLAELSTTDPSQTLECLRLIVQSDEIQWRMYGHKDEETRTIIRNAIESGDEPLRERAEELVHYLGAQELFQFRDLLAERAE
jgi:hypothetical protein